MQGSLWSSLARALGLGKGGPGDREKEIQKHLADLKDPNPERRRSAAWSLGKMKPGPKEALPALTELSTKDPVEFVRKAAQWAIKNIRGS